MGQGATTAKNSSETIDNKSIGIDQSRFTTLNQSCISLTKQNNKVNIVGSRVKNLTVEQRNAAQTLCILQSIMKENKNSDIQEQVLKTVLQEAETKGGIIPGGNSENISKMTKNMTLNLDQSVVENITKDCILEQEQSNVINIIGSDVQDSVINQINESMAECMSSHESTGEYSSGLKSILQQDDSQKAKSTGSNFFDDIIKSIGGVVNGLFGSWTNMLIAFGAFIVISSSISALSSFFMMGGGSSGSGSGGSGGVKFTNPGGLGGPGGMRPGGPGGMRPGGPGGMRPGGPR